MNVNRVEFVCGRHIHPSTTLTHQLSQPLPRSNAVSSCITFITQELEQENPTPIILMILFVMVPGAWSAPHIQRKLGVRGHFFSSFSSTLSPPCLSNSSATILKLPVGSPSLLFVMELGSGRPTQSSGLSFTVSVRLARKMK